MKILVLAGDYWHPSAVVKAGLLPLEKAGFSFDFTEEGNDITPHKLKEYDVLIIAKGDMDTPSDGYQGWKTKENEAAIIDYVKNGGGLLTIHAGTVVGKDGDDFAQLIGCRFITHPRETEVIVAPMKPHPITAGIEPFSEVDEHYGIEIYTEDAEILFASTAAFQGSPEKYETEPYDNCPTKIYPSGYVKTAGNGKICVLTPGHFEKVWRNPQYEKTLINAINWLSSN